MYQQNYNYYPQQQQQPQSVNQLSPQAYFRQAPPQVGLKGRLVSSLEEARATSIDFDGSVFYFPDLANKLIYTKQINIDGTATMNVYELKEMPKEATLANSFSTEQFVTKDEFERALSQLKQDLNAASHQKPELLSF